MRREGREELRGRGSPACGGGQAPRRSLPETKARRPAEEAGGGGGGSRGGEAAGRGPGRDALSPDPAPGLQTRLSPCPPPSPPAEALTRGRGERAPNLRGRKVCQLPLGLSQQIKPHPGFTGSGPAR